MGPKIRSQVVKKRLRLIQKPGYRESKSHGESKLDGAWAEAPAKGLGGGVASLPRVNAWKEGSM